MVTSYLFMEQTLYEKVAPVGCGQCLEASALSGYSSGKESLSRLTASKLYF